MKIDKREIKDAIIVVSILSIAGIFSIGLLGNNVEDAITKSTCNLTNKVYVDGMKSGEGSCIEKW